MDKLTAIILALFGAGAAAYIGYAAFEKMKTPVKSASIPCSSCPKNAGLVQVS